jgi:hypothetical protein
MEYKNTDFPQYRKLSNNRSFYEILDDRNFREIQLIGARVMLHLVKAEQYPEILRIMDMLNLQEPYLLSDAEEFKRLEDLNV